MRTSTYEIFLPLIGTDEKPVEGRVLLFNGLYGAADIVTEEERHNVMPHALPLAALSPLVVHCGVQCMTV